jgi:L-ascorbate metabolism protein UlaG (beta-lactamase superfamily)
MAEQPRNLSIRTYDVGFGDCFLLTFDYAKRPRHVLIDFGTMSLPERKDPRGYMQRVADQIAEDCGGRLDAVVATHRHQDHVSGFARDKNGKGPGATIRGLKPRVVVQPWTEDPRASRNAKAPMQARRALHLRTLQTMHNVAQAATDTARLLRGGEEVQALRAQLAAIGMDNIKNAAAIKNLQTMGARTKFVHFGSKSGLERILPGVKVTVLGPPTIKQTSAILQQRREDPDEFWHSNANFWTRAALTAGQGPGNSSVLFPRHAAASAPLSARWYMSYATREHADSLLSIVRILDDAMNNTSVILLFEVRGKLILFPGDAQYENWMYALSQRKVLKKLSGVDVLKIGHHGSLNATPLTLWNALAKRGGSRRARRLTALLSTKDDVHGHRDRRTEVPRRTLERELERNTQLIDTRDFKESDLSKTIDLKL